MFEKFLGIIGTLFVFVSGTMAKTKTQEPDPNYPESRSRVMDRAAEIDNANNPNPLAFTDTSVPVAPDMTPTAAEYERDRILEQEQAAKAAEKRKQLEEARASGELPPGAQTLEEARAAIAKAEELAQQKPEETR